MYTELNKIRQDLKRVLADLTKIETEYAEQLAKINYVEHTESGNWTDTGPLIMRYAQRSGDNLLKQVHKILFVMARERKLNRPKKAKNDDIKPRKKRTLRAKS